MLEWKPEKGGCYANAFHSAYTNKNKFAEIHVCHGIVTNNSSELRFRMGHAWTEYGDMVIDYDPFKDKYIHVSKEWYYKAGEVNPDEVIRYEPIEALVKMSEFEHYGPWDKNRIEFVTNEQDSEWCTPNDDS